MADEIIGGVKVAIGGDFSPLMASFAESKTAAQSAGAAVSSAFAATAGNIKTAQEAVKSAYANMQQAATEFGKHAAAGNAEAQKILNQYAAELKTAQANLDGLSAAEVKNSAAASGMSNSTRAAAAATAQLKSNVAEAKQQAESFVGVIPGLGRAAERFISLIPGAGSAIMSIFPLLGGAALAQNIIPIIGHVASIVTGWGQVSEEEKKAAEEAQRVDEKVVEIGRHLAQIEMKQFVARFGELAGKGKEAADSSAALQAGRNRVAAIAAQQAAAAEDVRSTQEAISDPTMEGSDKLGYLQTLSRQKKALAELTLTLKQERAKQEEAEKSSGAVFDDLIQKALDQTVKQNNERVDAQNEAARKLREANQDVMQAYRGMFADLQADHQLSKAEEIDYWANVLKELEQGGSKYKETIREINRTLGSLHQEKYKEDAADVEKTKTLREAEHEAGIRFARQMRDADTQFKKSALTSPGEQTNTVSITKSLGEQLAGGSGLGGAFLNKALILSKEFHVESLNALNAEMGRLQEAERLAVAMNIPLSEQKKLREDILDLQVRINKAEGRTSTGLSIQKDFQQIGAAAPGNIGNAAAAGVLSGHIGREITNSLKGIGQQLLGGVFKNALTSLAQSLGVNTAAHYLLASITTGHGAVMLAHAGVMVGHGIAVVANTFATLGNTIAVIWNTIVQAVKGLFGFAEGGSPPVGIPSIVGEKGPEIFVPREAGVVIPNHMIRGYADGAGLSDLQASSTSSSLSIASLSFHAHGVASPQQFAEHAIREIPRILKTRSPQFSPYSRR